MYDDIHLFVQLINAGGFSHVAKKLNTHQATISKRIMKLEQTLNMTLLNRNTRNLQLTEEGSRLYEKFKNQFESIEQALDSVKNKKNNNTHEGKLSICMSPSLSTKEINGHILDFTLLYPKVMLDIHYVLTDVNLLKDNYDLAITLNKPLQETSVIRTIWQLNTILVASKEYIARYGEPATLADLEKHKIILPLISMRTNSILEGVHSTSNQLVTQKFNRHCIALNSSGNNLNFALTGKCIVPLYDCVAQEYLDNGSLVRILPEYQALPTNVYLARPTSYKNKLVDLFANYVSECIKAMGNERAAKIAPLQSDSSPIEFGADFELNEMTLETQATVN
jgi:DNA-binding transcriptional LysR family regulator